MDITNVEILYAINSQFPSPRANSIQALNTCAALARTGAVVRLLARRKGSGNQDEVFGYYGVDRADGLTVEFLPTVRWGSDKLFNLSFQVSLAARLMRRDRDPARRRVLFTRDLLSAAAILRLRPVLKLPVLYEVHALNHLTNPIFTNTVATARSEARLKAREGYVYSQSSRLIAISCACRDALASAFPDARPAVVVPDGTPYYVRPAEKKTGAGSKTLLYVGQFYPWKGVEAAVRALPYLPGYRLAVYGGNYFTAASDIARLRAVAVECACEPAVEFRGFIEPQRMRDLLAGDFIGILPAADNVMGRHFISPLKLFEYMGCSIPVVASDLPPIREVIEHERNGLLFRPGDAADLARQVNRLQESPELRRRIVDAAFADAQRYSYDHRARQLLEVIGDVLSGGGPG